MRKYTRRGQIFFTKLSSFTLRSLQRESMLEESSKRRGEKRKKSKNVHRTISCITCVGFFLVEHSTKTTTIGIFLLLGRFPSDIYRRGGKTRIGKKVPTHPPCHDLGIRDLGNEMRKVQELAHVP